MKRRNFIKAAALLGVSGAIPAIDTFASGSERGKQSNINASSGSDDREYWVELLCRMSEPIMRNMSKGELHKNMKMQFGPAWDKNRNKEVGYLEAFGRLLAGLAPWLGLPDDNTKEGKKRKQMREWILKSIANSVDPANADYLSWSNLPTPQTIVDAAFVAQGLLRSPKALWEPLDSVTKERMIKEFKDLRRITPYYNNWLLFASTIEAFLLSIGEEYDRYRIEMGVRKINEWYVGDGWYSDGVNFHMDYYNSFVIQPMLIDVLQPYVHIAKAMPVKTYETALGRMQRNADFLERVIAPEGTFPPFGRSITYRLAVFQPLAQLAFMEKLPQKVSNAQVRCALTAVMKRMFSVEGNFDADNYLQLGFVGYQPEVADSYSNTGSLYLTSVGFLPLGLPADHDFWSSAPADWTAKKAWSGQSFPKDSAISF
ncbi:MAG: DUF2264 domain-containing protein [Dysgonomonas sp.]|nr:DUF2264 domain-containing protein [Dysgonomonas sp.]